MVWTQESRQLIRNKQIRWRAQGMALAFLLVLSSSLWSASASAADWSTLIAFNEAGPNGFPSSSTNLLNADGTKTLTYDIYSGFGEAGIEPTAGTDGTVDLTVVVTLVTSENNTWSRTEADYSTSSKGSFRSDWRVNPSDCSAENSFAYAKFDFFFSGALSNIHAGQFLTRHTSTNGGSEAYEYTLVTLNGSGNSTIESGLAMYKNTQYIAGESMSEHIFGVTDPDAQGGSVPNNVGVWAIDDFNTIIAAPPSPEEPTTNPQSGNGSTNDDQEISGSDFGLDVGEPVTQVTYYFGLQDVAFDTDLDGCTQTNTTPSAGVTWFEIGYEEKTSVELSTFTASEGSEKDSGNVTLHWATAAETDNAGFNLYASPTTNGPWERINRALIPAEGSPWGGAEYSFSQEKGAYGYYQLEDIDFYGRRTYHGPISFGNTAASTGPQKSMLFVPLR